jgi:hypothetical protein
MLKTHSWFFYLCALEGAAAMAALFLIPSEGGRLSPARLALIGLIAAIAMTWLILGLRRSRLPNRLARPAFIVVTAFLAVVFGLLLFLLRYLNPVSALTTYQRLSPLLWYLLILSVQSFLFLLTKYRGFHPERLGSRRPLRAVAMAAFCFLLIVLLFIAFTRLGITPDPAYWGEPGVPLLGWQFALALIGGLLVLGLMLTRRAGTATVLLPLGIYILALILWLSVPADVLANSFYMPMGPPTFQPFPYSDAGYYDQMAQSLLIGHPYQGTIPTRPLYVFLLTVLHLVFGENYRNIIIGQTLVLAAIPVVFYVLGKRLHSPIAGVVVALFFIFREFTSLLVSSDTRVSNTKTLMVDLPTLLLLTLACLFSFRWLERRDAKSALIAGGLFGLLLLLRTQSMLVLPMIFLVALLALGWKNKRFYLLSSFFFLGLVITVIPWLTHNYLQIGQFAFDAPFQYKIIASQYAYSGNLDIENYDFEGKGLGRVLIEFALKDPAFVFGFIANHFLASQIHGLLALPLIKPYNGIFEPVNLYWMEWDGRLEWYNIVLLIIYLAVIAVGLASAWKRWRWLGLLPLVFSLGYALATAVGRFSGWRYDLPADWIWYFYFGIGFAELLLQAALGFGASEEAIVGTSQAPAAQPIQQQIPALFLAALFFALVSALPWLAKNIAPPRYAEQSEKSLASLDSALASDEIEAFLSQPGVAIQTGRVLYPRFFGKSDGLASANPWPAYEIRDYPRMGFLLLNQSSQYVVLPTRRLPEFPHAQDAVVLGCQSEGYVEAHWVIFPGVGSVYSSEAPVESCSP